MVQPQKTLTTIWQVSDELGNNLKQILAQYDPPNPLGRKRNLTDRAKPGTKRSLLVEAEGGPLAVVVGGANVHDCKLLEATLEAIIVERPKPQDIEQQRHPARLWVEGANTRLALQVQSNLSAL
jgi:hypothetical protein